MHRSMRVLRRVKALCSAENFENQKDQKVFLAGMKKTLPALSTPKGHVAAPRFVLVYPSDSPRAFRQMDVPWKRGTM